MWEIDAACAMSAGAHMESWHGSGVLDFRRRRPTDHRVAIAVIDWNLGRVGPSFKPQAPGMVREPNAASFWEDYMDRDERNAHEFAHWDSYLRFARAIRSSGRFVWGDEERA